MKKQARRIKARRVRSGTNWTGAIVAAGLFAACFCALPALAQSSQSGEGKEEGASRRDRADRFAVKLGALFSPSGAGRTGDLNIGNRATHNFEGEAEVSYDLTRSKSTTRNVLSLYGDYVFAPRHTIHFAEQGLFDFAKGTVSTTISGYALGVSQRHYVWARGGRASPYVDLGIGLYHQQKHAMESVDYYTNFGSYVGVEHNDRTTESGSDTELGGKFALGVEFKSGLLVELSVQRFPISEAINLSGASLMIGHRL